MKRTSLFAAAVLGFAMAAGSVDAAVLRVIVVQTPDPAAYAKEVQKGQAILKRLGSPATIRIWRARFAGTDAGAVVASIEYPDLAAYADSEAKIGKDAEYQTFIKGLEKMRKIVSDSLYDELK